MKSAPLHVHEIRRLQALNRYAILDTDPEQVFDDLTFLASHICETPIALISLIDPDRQWFKAKTGLDATETCRDIAFCSHAINQDSVLVISDATKDERFFDNPLVLEDPCIRFYAGAPLITPEGLPLGTICAIDRKPRTLSDGQIRALQILAEQVISQLELRRTLKFMRESFNEGENVDADKMQYLQIVAHDLRGPLHGILGIASLLIEDFEVMPSQEIKDLLNRLRLSAKSMSLLLDNLVKWSVVRNGKLSPEKTEINLSVLVSRVMSVMGAAFKIKRVQLNVKVETDITIKADAAMLFSIFQNLLANALKYSSAGNEVVIQATLNNGFMTIDVVDHGGGISKDKIKKLLSSKRVDSVVGTAGEVGIGIGFKLVSEFVRLHKGSISIDSHEGVGTTVQISLPVEGENSP